MFIFNRKFYLVLSFVLSLGIIFIVSEVNKNERIELSLENHINKLKIHYDLQKRHIVHFSDEAYKNLINDPYLLNKLQTALETTDQQELSKLRNELFKHLEDRFEGWKADGVSQIHFIFPNNISFLRMHKPNQFGDNLSNIREDIKYANETKKYLFDLTGGKSEINFRNIFPIFSKNGKYLGAVDISIPVSFLQKEFFNLSKMHTHFLVNKTLLTNKIWSAPDDTIFKSAENENLILVLTENHTKEKCITERKKILLPKYNEIQQKLSSGQPFSIYSDQEFDNKIRAISFYPLNINQHITGWIVSYEIDDVIAYTNKVINIDRVIFSLLLFILFYFIHKLLEQKAQLEIQTKQILRRNKEFEVAQSTAKLGSWFLDFEKNQLSWSDEVYNIFEIDKNTFEPSYESSLELVHPDDKEYVRDAFANSLATNEKHSIEHRIITTDGRIKWLKEECDTRYSSKGKPLYSNGTVQDITELKNKQNELNQEKLLLKTIINSLPVRVFWKDSNGVYLGANKPFLQDANLDKESDILGKTDYEMVWKTEAELYTQDDKKVMLSRIPKLNFIEKQTQLNGQEIILNTSKVPLLDLNNTIIGILGTYQDITKEQALTLELEELNKNLEEKVFLRTKEVKESEIFLFNIMESAIDGIVTINEYGLIQTFNKAAENLFGYTRDEVIGKNVKVLVPSPHMEKHDQYLKNYLSTGIPKAIGSTAEVGAKRKDGTVFPASIRIGEIKLNEKRIFTALIQDISERKKHEQELIDAKEEAENATKAKSSFLANMSHEIRTPMNGIIGMAHLVLKTDLDSQQKNYIEKINSSANTLLNIINDILDISKIEAGKLELYKSNFDLFKTIDSVLSLVELKAYSKNLDITVEYDPNLGKEFYGDSLRINQILTNLFSNAVKFTSEGEIGLKIKNLGNNRVRFEVSDTGIGLSDEQMGRLFQSFSQADNTTTKKYGGTGLGLAISKQLVKMMKGDISVESQLGKGSKFSFEIELEKVHSDSKYTIFQGRKVLIIDDCQSWLDILSHLMNTFGFDVSTVDSGKEAIEILKNGDKEYDLILVDWNMPELDGIETCKILENDLHIDSHKIILVSTYNKEIFEENIKDVAIDYYLHKPVNPSLLNDVLSTIFYGNVYQNEHSKIDMKKDLQNRIKTLKGSHILLAEDNEINQEIIVDLLKDSEITIDIANNGHEAVLKINEKKDLYELILMDIQMPILDGYEATKQLRSDGIKIPIIALTANAMKEDEEKAQSVGMNKHLSKPIDVQKLYETLLEFISPKVDIETTHGETTMHTARIESSNSLPKFHTIDTEYGLNLVLGNEQVYTQILKGLLKYKNIDYIALDDEEFKRTMHSIKGLSASAGALALSEQAKIIEQTLNRELLGAFLEKLNVIVNEIETNLQMNSSVQKVELDSSKRDELFTMLKEAIETKRAKNCKPIIEELEKYTLHENDAKLFEAIKTLTSKFEFKEALKLF